jgi:hypothetical protein
MPSRRAFFRLLADEGCATVEELRGRRQLRLSELPRLPDALLAQIVPVILPGVRIEVTGEVVLGKLPGREEAVELFAYELSESVDSFIFNRFNGQKPIGRISQDLAAAKSLGPEESFGRVREFFLRLVRHGVCAPGNPVVEGG